jgi:hypothetical protein
MNPLANVIYTLWFVSIGYVDVMTKL